MGSMLLECQVARSKTWFYPMSYLASIMCLISLSLSIRHMRMETVVKSDSIQIRLLEPSISWAQLLSWVWLFGTLWIVVHQAPLSIAFSRQEYQNGLSAISFTRVSSQPREWTQVSHTAGRLFTVWATSEEPQYISKDIVRSGTLVGTIQPEESLRQTQDDWARSPHPSGWTPFIWECSRPGWLIQDSLLRCLCFVMDYINGGNQSFPVLFALT